MHISETENLPTRWIVPFQERIAQVKRIEVNMRSSKVQTRLIQMYQSTMIGPFAFRFVVRVSGIHGFAVLPVSLFKTDPPRIPILRAEPPRSYLFPKAQSLE